MAYVYTWKSVGSTICPEEGFCIRDEFCGVGCMQIFGEGEDLHIPADEQPFAFSGERRVAGYAGIFSGAEDETADILAVERNEL